MMAKTHQESTKRAISLYFTQLQNTRPCLAGKDLLNLGYEPGPRYKLILKQLLDAHLYRVAHKQVINLLTQLLRLQT